MPMDEQTIAEPEVKKQGVEIGVPMAIILNAIIIGIAIIIAAVLLGGHTSPKQDQPAPVVTVDIKNVKTAGDPFIGNPQATVVLAFWSDFQCPYCKVFETTTFQTILKNYVQSGKVAVVFKDYPFLGPDSTTAGMYGRAVWDLYPNTYFAWREAMYNAQDKENSGFGDEASIVALTGTVPGIDAAKVQKQVAAKKDVYAKAIEADRQEGVDFGIEGTPSFITGTKLIVGNSPYSSFSAAFDAQLK